MLNHTLTVFRCVVIDSDVQSDVDYVFRCVVIDSDVQSDVDYVFRGVAIDSDVQSDVDYVFRWCCFVYFVFLSTIFFFSFIFFFGDTDEQAFIN
jgi:hypothetical protein